MSDILASLAFQCCAGRVAVKNPLVPDPIERLGHQTELDNEVAGQVFGLGLAALFAPEAEQGDGLVVAHDDAGVGAAYKGTS
jgi:hypothetical protein